MTDTVAVAEADTDVPPAGRTGRIRRPRTVPAWSAFLLLVGVFGVTFALLTPPFWGHDEISQFGRAYQVSRGGVLPVPIPDDRGPAWGGGVPVSIERLMNYALDDYTTSAETLDEPEPAVADRSGYRPLEDAPVSARHITIWFTNTAAYSPVPYLPQAFGIRVAQLLDVDTGGLLLAPRLAGLAAYLAVIGFGLFALRRTRVQWLVFAVAVLPITVFQAGTVTADTLTNAVAITLSALLIKALFLATRLTWAETAVLLVAAIALPLCKPSYVLLALLVVVVPASRLGLRGPLRLLPGLSAAIGTIGFLAWTRISAPTTDGMSVMRPKRQWHTVVPADQLQQMLHNPGEFLTTFGESIMRRDQEWFVEFFGELGFAYVTVPATSVLAGLLAFAIGVGIAERMSGPSNRITTLVLLTVLISVVLIYVALYLSFTPVGYYLIDGVQGRYFVPLALLAFAVLLRWLPLRLQTESGPPATRGPAIVIVTASTIALVLAVVKYNLLVWG
ncbi:DUF2142 domain-containing protein [Skermania piniformis]|uniref:DUF2142 domain-containing protein n=1 Tax=Skermania pinensis TaxID=39122 RepID=UPI00082B10C4|nr:DUF2142 domain-containing protein [Skermania piniformis]